MTDWSKLEHAYGLATDVPVMIDAIAEGKTSAVERLRNCVAHQGWSSPAVARAVTPLLLESTTKLKGKQLAAVVELLADLACAGSHEHFMGTGFEASSLAGLLAEPDVAATRALTAGVDATKWLGDRSSNVRSAAALFLAFTDQDESVALAARLAKEKVAKVVVDLVLTLGWAASEPPDAVVELQDDSRSEVAAAAWIATAFASARLTEDIERGLLSAATEGDVGCAWAAGDLRTLAVELLRHRALAEQRPEALVQLLEIVEPIQRTRIGAGLIWNAFRVELAEHKLGRTPDATAPPALESLTEEQKHVLRLLTRFDTGWGHSGDQVVVLRILGLPRFPPEMLLYLGDDPPPPDQRDVPFRLGDHSGTFAEVLVAVCTQENQALIPKLVAATRNTFEDEELLDVIELSQQPIVPSGFTRSAWALHLVLDVGPPILPALRARLERYCRDGAPLFWNAHGRIRATALPMVLWAALLELEPDAQPPKNFSLGMDRKIWEKSLEGYEPSAATWMRKALRRVSSKV